MQIRCVARNLLVSIALFLVVPVSGYAANVIADGKEWRQVTETINTSWNTLAATCDLATGVCGGAYNGWTWANRDEVLSLFESFSIPISVTGLHTEMNSVWAPSFLSEFVPTYGPPDASSYGVVGITRSTSGAAATAGEVQDSPFGYVDMASVDLSYPFHLPLPFYGAWMYTTAPPIPEPETYALMGIGLSLLGWVGRRRKLQPS